MIRRETQPPEGSVHQRPDSIVAGAMPHLGRSAFQGRSRSQTGTHLSRSPVPSGTTQYSQVDPLPTAVLTPHLKRG